MSSGKTRRVPLKLYWATTPDHSEDWFIVARNAAQARRRHEDAEGYDRGDAEAEFVCRLPDTFQDADVIWPTEAMLRACGAEFLPNQDGADIVRIAGQVFVAGDIVMNIAVRLGAVSTN